MREQSEDWAQSAVLMFAMGRHAPYPMNWFELKSAWQPVPVGHSLVVAQMFLHVSAPVPSSTHVCREPQQLLPHVFPCAQHAPAMQVSPAPQHAPLQTFDEAQQVPFRHC
jgi:hypothetical protein